MNPGAEPFAILGLDPATCDAAAIKAAYARLVKDHRPDRDPAGFRRVRDAYEFCRSPLGEAHMALARGGWAELEALETAQHAEVDAAAAAAPGAGAEPSPMAIFSAWEAESAAAPAAPAPGPSAAPAHAPGSSPALRMPAPAPGSSPALRMPAAPPIPFRTADDLDALIAGWDAGDQDPLVRTAKRWLARDDWTKLRELGWRWLERVAERPDAATGEFALQLADLLALYDAGLAGDLLDAGFRLASSARDDIPADLDLRLHVGKILARIDDGLRGELLTALRRGDIAGGQPDLARRLRAVLSTLPRDQYILQLINQRLPMMWTSEPTLGAPRPAAPGRSTAPGRNADPTKSRELARAEVAAMSAMGPAARPLPGGFGGFGRGVVVGVVGLVLVMVLHLVLTLGTRHPPPRDEAAAVPAKAAPAPTAPKPAPAAGSGPETAPAAVETTYIPPVTVPDEPKPGAAKPGGPASAGPRQRLTLEETKALLDEYQRWRATHPQAGGERDGFREFMRERDGRVEAER